MKQAKQPTKKKGKKLTLGAPRNTKKTARYRKAIEQMVRGYN